MGRKCFDVSGSRPAAVFRFAAVVAAVLLVITGGGCRRQGDSGPRSYERERAGSLESAGQRLESSRVGPPDRYPWRGKNETGIEQLPERIVEIGTRFKQESDEHHQVIHGWRKQP